jgi:hypothetical protein
VRQIPSDSEDYKRATFGLLLLRGVICHHCSPMRLLMAAESISHDRHNFFPAKMTMASFLFNCPKTISDYRTSGLFCVQAGAAT